MQAGSTPRRRPDDRRRRAVLPSTVIRPGL